MSAPASEPTQAGVMAAMIAIGDELLEGRHPDLNSSSIASSLLPLGLHAGRFEVAPDDEEVIAESMRRLGRQYGIVITTGGLGPTLDDVTRAAAARAMGQELVLSEEARRQVTDWYRRTGRVMPEANERQMWIPAGAELLRNEQGTAPGFRVEGQGFVLFCLPGPPSEMRPMLEAGVLPWLRRERALSQASAERKFHLFGLSESVFADQVAEWMVRGANPQMGVTFSRGTLTVRVVGWAAGPDAAEALVERRAVEFRQRFGEFVYSEAEADPAVLLVEAARARGLRLALAESCTGGLVSARLTSVPGASDVLLEGFVTYSNRAKASSLGVPQSLLDEHGAVSEPVARAMATGARAASGADAAVAITGVAGPGGGTEDKPVGLVWFATSAGDEVRSEQRRFPPVSRVRIQEWASTTALRLLTRAVESAG